MTLYLELSDVDEVNGRGSVFKSIRVHPEDYKLSSKEFALRILVPMFASAKQSLEALPRSSSS